jgi:hypothetical protein
MLENSEGSLMMKRIFFRNNSPTCGPFMP